MNTTITTTPRPGETAEQTAARSAPRGAPDPSARHFYLTEPSRGVFIVCFQANDSGEIQRLKISKNQLGNFLVDGAGMALRDCEPSRPRVDSVRLGPEALEPAKPYVEPA